MPQQDISNVYANLIFVASKDEREFIRNVAKSLDKIDNTKKELAYLKFYFSVVIINVLYKSSPKEAAKLEKSICDVAESKNLIVPSPYSINYASLNQRLKHYAAIGITSDESFETIAKDFLVFSRISTTDADKSKTVDFLTKNFDDMSSFISSTIPPLTDRTKYYSQPSPSANTNTNRSANSGCLSAVACFVALMALMCMI